MNKSLQSLVDFSEATRDRFFTVDYSGCTKRWTVNVFLGAGYTCPGAKVIDRRDRWLEVNGSTYEAVLLAAAARLPSVRPLAVAR